MATAAQKAAQVRRLLKSGAVVVRVDPRGDGVVLPRKLLRLKRLVALAFARNDPDDLRVTKTGITATLTFGKRLVPCVLPWGAVTSIEAREWPEEAPEPPEPWTPPPARDFAGAWHWDDVRASIDAVICSLPEDGSLWRRLDMHDTQARHDSTLVYRWGVELGKLWELPDPSAYASALTNSQAIHRMSLATREGCTVHASEQERLELEGMAELARIRRGLPTNDEVAPARGQSHSWSPYHDFDTVHVIDGKEIARPARLGPNYTSEEMVVWLRAVHEYNSAVAAAHAKAFDEAFRKAVAQ